MTVGELIQALQRCNANTPVILASDEEGNSFANCDVVRRDWFDEDMEHLDQEVHGAIEYIVLWP